MIRNKFAGRCQCKALVEPGAGFVIGRKIWCATHAADARGADDEERDARMGEFEDRDIHGFDDW